MPNAFQDAVAAVQGEAAPEAPEVEETSQQDVELDLSDDNEVMETDESPAVDAPNSWSKEDREQFSTLPHETQVSIANRERDRDLNIRQSQDKVAEERKAFEVEQSSVKDQKAKLLEKMKVYGPKEPSADMLNPEHESYDPDAYHLSSARFKESSVEMQKVEDEISLESVEERKKWQLNEIENYKKDLPEFVDVEKGPAFRQKLAEYATKALNITMEQASQQFPITPASDMIILNKAMLYDAAVAKQKSGKQTPKPKSLSPGNSNPKKVEKPNVSKATADWHKNRSPEAAAALLSVGKK